MSNPLILFPHQPFSPREIDTEFTSEFESARSVGFDISLYDHEAIEKHEICRGLKNTNPKYPNQPLILRGWMLPGEAYAKLYQGLVKKGFNPITKPDQYEQAHYIPLAYPQTKGHTPKTAWIEGDDPQQAWNLYQEFNSKEAIIKDWVKSAKSRWKDACYIPAHTQKERFLEIFQNFRSERSKLFNRGVVLREFIPIVERGSDIRGLPIIEETRLFFWHGKLVVPPQAKSPSPLDEIERWQMIANRFQSKFMTIDVALLTDGTWKIVEVGDGGVSGLPVSLDPERFYASLWNHSQETSNSPCTNQ